MTGIAVPVIIHLWNIRQGKTRKVGSIAFLTETASTRAKSFKLSELWLLLLRCLLLIMLALLISRPYWENQPGQKEKGWVLIEKQSVQQAYRSYKPIIDSLLDQGFTFHYFNEGFPQTTLAVALKSGNDSNARSITSYWALLQQLNQQVTASLPVYLFTGNLMRNVSGSRPNVALNVRWLTYSEADSAKKWIHSAYETSDDSIRVVMGNSSAGGTYYSWHDISNQTSNSMFTASLEKGKTLVTYKDPAGLNNKVETDSSTVEIIVYTDKAEDAGYLTAALAAIRDLTKHKIRTTVVRTLEGIPSTYNWLFWLSDSPVPPSLIKNKIFVYQQGKPKDVHSVMVTGNVPTYSGGTIPVYKIISQTGAENSFPVWKNGYGDAILSKDSLDVFNFYSRFDPQWNGMVWNDQFPAIIYALVFGEDDNMAMSNEDQRVIAEQQLRPALVAEEDMFHKQGLIRQTDLSTAFWFIAFLLFLLERIISSRKKKGEVYG